MGQLADAEECVEQLSLYLPFLLFFCHNTVRLPTSLYNNFHKKKKKKRGLAKTFISSEEKMNGKDLDRYCDHTSHVSLPSETTPVVSQKGKKHHKNCSSAAKFGLQSKIPTELTLSNLSKWR